MSLEGQIHYGKPPKGGVLSISLKYFQHWNGSSLEMETILFRGWFSPVCNPLQICHALPQMNLQRLRCRDKGQTGETHKSTRATSSTLKLGFKIRSVKCRNKSYLPKEGKQVFLPFFPLVSLEALKQTSSLHRLFSVWNFRYAWRTSASPIRPWQSSFTLWSFPGVGLSHMLQHITDKGLIEELI